MWVRWGGVAPPTQETRWALALAVWQNGHEEAVCVLALRKFCGLTVSSQWTSRGQSTLGCGLIPPFQTGFQSIENTRMNTSGYSSHTPETQAIKRAWLDITCSSLTTLMWFSSCHILFLPPTYIGATLTLWVTVCIKKFLRVTSYLYLHEGSSYEAETKTKI